MTDKNNPDFQMDCSCGGGYAALAPEQIPPLFKQKKNETLYRCPDCGSTIGVRQGKSKFAQITVYDNVEEQAEETHPLSEDPEIDTSPSILSIKERLELNRSRINFDISKNFLTETIDNTKIRFRKEESRIVCVETEVGEDLWHMDLTDGTDPTGIYYLDYQMVLLEKGDVRYGTPSGLIDNVLSKNETADIHQSQHRGKDQVYSISRKSESSNLEFHLLVPDRSRKQNQLPDHNHFQIVDPILGRTYVRRAGKLNAHSLGMDFLYFCYTLPSAHGTSYVVEAVPTNLSVGHKPYIWRRSLPFAPHIMIEYDDFLILECKRPQLSLFEDAEYAMPDERDVSTVRFLLERKNGNIYNLKDLKNP